MKTKFAIAGVLLLALSLAGAAQAASETAAAPPALVRLGQQLHLTPAQQPQWQAALDAAGRARGAAESGLRDFAAQAESELKKPDADLDRLSQLQQRHQQEAQAMRAEARQALLGFYAQATPEQQATMRQFLLDQIERLQRLQALREQFRGGA
jgi:hypothetical protein